MKFFRMLAGAVCLAAIAPIGQTVAFAQSSEKVPMFCSLRAMGGQSRDYYVSDVFWGDYNRSQGYKNRFAAWINAEYGSLGGQYATYCFYGDDEDQAYYKRDRTISSEHGSGNYVISTYWRG